MAHLFFSYAHNDYDRLIPIFQRMELVTERMIWIDRIGLQRDAEWLAMIERAIKSSYGVIFAVTKTFVERPFILDKEIPWALERFNDSRQGKLLFPILLDDVPLPTALNGPNVQFCKQVLDARDGDYERVIQELKQVIPEATGEDYPFVVSWPRLRNFKGRDQQLVELHTALHTEDGKAGIKTVGMYGTGGIGKTQLAVEFAYRYRFYFPGGVFWLNAAQDWQREVADCADRLALKPIDPNDTNRNKQMALAFEQYRKANGQEALLVLDNVENPRDLTTREIAPKLTIPDLCKQTRTRLIVTTRVQMLPEGFARVEVTKLAPADALAVLLDAWQGGQDTPPRTDTPDEKALNAMAQLFDYLPLPLGWMAAALRQKATLQPSKLLDNLRKQGVDETIARLKKGGVSLGTPEYYAALVSAGLDWQIAQIDNANALHLLTLIAAYGEAAVIPAARLRLLVDFDTDDLFDPFEEAVDALRKYSLVETQQNGTAFRLHPLEREHLRRKVPDFRAQLGEAAEHLTHAYRTPDVLVRETLARGFEAVLADLRETQPAIPTDVPVLGSLSELRRYLDWEAYHLRGQYPAGTLTHDSGQKFLFGRHRERGHYPTGVPTYDGGQYLIQHLRERAHHQGTDSILRNDCDHWLEAHQMPHFKSHEAWRYPNDPALLRIFEGHSETVNAVAFASDGRTALSGSVDGSLRLWDVVTGAEIRRFKGHSGSLKAVAFAPDGRIALSGSRSSPGSSDNTLRLWDVNSGTELRRFEGHSSYVSAVAFAPDGSTALSGSGDKTLRLWDVASGAELRCFEGHSSYVSAVAFAPDGRTVLSGSGSSIDPSDNTLRLWDVASGAELRCFEGHSSYVSAVAFAPDGRTALSGSGDKTLRLWDVASGAELRRFEGHSSHVNAVAFAPNGRTALSGSGSPLGSNDNTLRLWDVASGAELRRFEGHSSYVSAVAFALNGRTALSASGNTLRLWNIADEAEPHRFEGHGRKINAMAFAPDDHTALSGSDDKTLRLWDVTSGAELRRFEGYGGAVNAVAFAPDGRTVLSASANMLQLWDVTSGVQLCCFEGNIRGVSAVAFAPDGRTALSGADHSLPFGSRDNTLRLWDVTSGVELRSFEGNSRVSAVAFAPDGRTALSGGTALSGADHSLPFGSRDNTLRLWDVTSGVELRCFGDHSREVSTVAFAPDGRTAMSGSFDKTLRQWDVATGAQLRRFEGHDGTVRAVAFTPDGRIVLSASADKTLRLWDVATGNPLAVLRLDAEAYALAVAATNPRLIMVGDGVGRVWVFRLYIAPQRS